MTNDPDLFPYFIIRAGKTRPAASLLVEAFAFGRQPAHLLRGMKAWAEAFVFLEHVEHFRQAERIRPPQDATARRWEADAQNKAHVHITRFAHDAFGKHPACFHEHG